MAVCVPVNANNARMTLHNYKKEQQLLKIFHITAEKANSVPVTNVPEGDAIDDWQDMPMTDDGKRCLFSNALCCIEIILFFFK